MKPNLNRQWIEEWAVKDCKQRFARQTGLNVSQTPSNNRKKFLPYSYRHNIFIDNLIRAEPRNSDAKVAYLFRV